MSPMARARVALRERTIAALRAELAAHPPEGVDRVVLFGSLARGDFDGASDADLVVVSLGDEADAARLPTVDGAVHDAAGRPCDVLPVTASNWRALMARADPFAVALRREGIVLWESSAAAAAAPSAEPGGDGLAG